MPLVNIIGTLHNSIDMCKRAYGGCNYMEVSEPLYELYKSLMDGDTFVGAVQDIREQVEIILTDHEGYYWKALKEKDGQGIGMTLE